MDESLNFIQELVGRVLKLDPAPLMIVLAWTLGYSLKAVPQFPNRFIPLVCMTVPTLLYPLLVFTAWEVRKVAQDFTLAIIFNGIAWVSHRFILKPTLDKMLFKGRDGNTEFLERPTDTNKPKDYE